ncbi:hypothetical protein QE177_15525 (plasmid) [Arsenophonus sp. aPb]|uniref:hypothetical protein n=1 Tax=Arsenophonus sp. aPb TaxID=3041619 RepID=UPI0024684D88|nr:hypothetical protein [Arsenophonus sp. aPb]WGL99924.1 hypothetical protein QE177_15525 [Arsenophonus sp. aPb]
MNYSNHEILRKDVALLVKKIDRFYFQLFEFEKKYSDDANDLIGCLIAQLIKPITKQAQNVYKQMIILDSAFKD